MKIGIDITPILYEGTGVGEYTRNLVGELLRQNQNDEFVLFFSTLRGWGKIKEKIKKIVDNATQSRHCEPRPRRDEAIFLSNKQIATSPRRGVALRNDVHIVGLPLPPWLWQFVWNRLNLIKIEWLIGKIDVFHCWDFLIPPSDCSRIVTIHDVTPFLFPETHTKTVINNYQLIINKIKKEKIVVLTVSENSKKDLIKHAGLDSNLIHVVYNGKDENESMVSTAENKYGKYILCVGTREPRKNLAKTVEAFALFAEKYPELQLVITGKYGWGEESVSSIKYQTLSIKDRIKILGFVSRDKLLQLYKNAVCLVYPSLYEGFGLPVLEAMQFGCPVIISNTSSLPEVGGEAVLYVDPNDVNELKSSMIRIIESNELREELIRKGLAQAKKFSWEKCGRETYRVYRKLMIK